MFLVTGLMVAAVILGKIMDAAMVLAASIVIFALLSGALYALIIKRTK